jgi:penicillin-binding protein A
MQSSTTDSARLARRSVAFFLFVAVAWTFYAILYSPRTMTRSQVAELVAPVVRANEFPQFIKTDEDDEDSALFLEYTVQPEGQAFIKRLIESYKPDYGAFVALDAESGEILSMVSYTKGQKEGWGNLALRSTFPAASIFKVITAAAAVDRAMMTPDTVIPFSGASHTLYRRQVFDQKLNRWTRYITLKEAFGKSINTVFAKVGLQYLDPEILLEYARRFKFSTHIPGDVPVETSRFVLPSDNNWKMAEVASGFNRESTLSPLHGAMIAAAIVNDGEMMVPHLVNRIYDREGGVLYEANPELDSKVIDPGSAKKLRAMMNETVKNGTSRRMFRDLMRMPAFEGVEFGGKTGSLMGTNPEGKTDWFVGYAKTPTRKIAVAAITVHKQFWTVRSGYLARRYFESLLQYKEQRQARTFFRKRRS